MEYHDRVLKCADCGEEFVFTSGEQSFYADKGFRNEPKRCKNCKATRSHDANGRGHSRPSGGNSYGGGSRDGGGNSYGRGDGASRGNSYSASRGGGSYGGAQRAETHAICSQCGKDTTVPFRPTQGRPVYCRDCFQQRRGTSAAAAAG
jgi:CxxC-x17-CxxC domain-containing protein